MRLTDRFRWDFRVFKMRVQTSKDIILLLIVYYYVRAAQSTDLQNIRLNNVIYIYFDDFYDRGA